MFLTLIDVYLSKSKLSSSFMLLAHDDFCLFIQVLACDFTNFPPLTDFATFFLFVLLYVFEWLISVRLPLILISVFAFLSQPFPSTHPSFCVIYPHIYDLTRCPYPHAHSTFCPVSPILHAFHTFPSTNQASHRVSGQFLPLLRPPLHLPVWQGGAATAGLLLPC